VSPLLRALKRVPWIVWALLAPAVVIGAVQLWTGGGKRVPVVGAGVIGVLRHEDAPPDTHYTLDVERQLQRQVEQQQKQAARVRQSVIGSTSPATRAMAENLARRAERAIAEWPDVIVIALDAAELDGGAGAEREAKSTLRTLTEHAENATAVPVVANLAPWPEAGEEIREAAGRVNEWWRTELCREEGLRIGLELVPHAADADAVRDAVAAAVLDGIARHDELRATTQEGR